MVSCYAKYNVSNLKVITQLVKALVENYGVKVDQTLHKEVLDRYAKLDSKPYSGFIQPRLVPSQDGDKVSSVKVEYPKSFFAQMMEYGKKYAFLPVMN